MLAEGTALVGAADGAAAILTAAASLDAACRFDLVAAEINRGNDTLLPVIDALDESRSPQEKSWIACVSQWEHDFYNFNNLIIDGDRVSAVLDRESSRLGDPAEDIAWTQQTLAAQILMPDFLARYEAGTNCRISAYHITCNRGNAC